MSGSFARRRWTALAALFGFLLDVCILLLVAGLSALAGVHPGETSPGEILRALAPVAAVFPASGMATGLYRRIAHLPARAHAALAGTAFLGGTPLFLLGLILSGEDVAVMRPAVAFLALLPAVYVIVWTPARALQRALRRRGFGMWKAHLVAEDAEAVRWRNLLGAIPEFGHDVLSTGGDARAPGIGADLTSGRIEQILVTSGCRAEELEYLLSLSDRSGADLLLLPRWGKHAAERAAVRDPVAVPLWPEASVSAWSRGVRRLVDVVLAALLLTILSPLFAVIAAAIRAESHGSLLFRQPRALGTSDPPFEFFKFRSMVREADEVRETLLGLNEADGALFKIREDPRRTRVGRILRRHSLDELPQLLNVLRGEMSLVGPRPLPVADLARIPAGTDLAFLVALRARAVPGMTGLWQISGRSDLDFRDMLLLDVAYIRQRSLVFDLEILLRTIPVVLFGRGGY